MSVQGAQGAKRKNGKIPDATRKEWDLTDAELDPTAGTNAHLLPRQCSLHRLAANEP